jgi:hypothetical protein
MRKYSSATILLKLYRINVPNIPKDLLLVGIVATGGAGAAVGKRAELKGELHEHDDVL